MSIMDSPCNYRVLLVDFQLKKAFWSDKKIKKSHVSSKNFFNFSGLNFKFIYSKNRQLFSTSFPSLHSKDNKRIKLQTESSEKEESSLQFRCFSIISIFRFMWQVSLRIINKTKSVDVKRFLANWIFCVKPQILD